MSCNPGLPSQNDPDFPAGDNRSGTRFRNFFDQSLMALAMLDSEGNILHVNRAFTTLWGMTEEQLQAIHYNILQDKLLEEKGIMPYVLAAYEGKAGRTPPVYYDPAENPGLQGFGRPRWLESHIFPLLDAECCIEEVVFTQIDVTDRIVAQERLAEKTQEYRSIFEATSDGMVICDFERLQVVEANPAWCQMHGLTREEVIGLPLADFTHPVSYQQILLNLGNIRQGNSLIVDAVSRRTGGASFFVDITCSGFSYQSKPHLLAVYRDVTEKAQAYQLLEQRVEERTAEISTLLDVSADLASTLELPPLMDKILTHLKKVVGYHGAVIMAKEDNQLCPLAARRPNSESEALVMKQSYYIDPNNPMMEIVYAKTPSIIQDIYDGSLSAQNFLRIRSAAPEELYSFARSWLGVPLVVKDNLIGVLSLMHAEPNYYTQRHADLALAFANQAAVAIENARLYEQAQSAAAMEERQRLARELHDSVSQALFGISIGTNSMRIQLDRDPAKLPKTLDYVSSLAQAGMAEMRALLFELRPESLEKEGLVAALTKQATAIQSRYGVEVVTEMGPEPPIPVRCKEALYRIGQESMNNTIKHAQATTINLRLTTAEGQLTLEVRDNGIGFDTTGSFPGHLGLQTMRERALKLGGTFELKSQPASGTCILVNLPLGV